MSVDKLGSVRKMGAEAFESCIQKANKCVEPLEENVVVDT